MPEIFYRQKVLIFLINLAKSDKKLVKKVKNSIDKLSYYPEIRNLWVKKLKGSEKCFCLKIKKVRIKFIFDDECIEIIEIQYRKDAYK